MDAIGNYTTHSTSKPLPVVFDVTTRALTFAKAVPGLETETEARLACFNGIFRAEVAATVMARIPSKALSFIARPKPSPKQMQRECGEGEDTDGKVEQKSERQALCLDCRN